MQLVEDLVLAGLVAGIEVTVAIFGLVDLNGGRILETTKFIRREFPTERLGVLSCSFGYFLSQFRVLDQLLHVGGELRSIAPIRGVAEQSGDIVLNESRHASRRHRHRGDSGCHGLEDDEPEGFRLRRKHEYVGGREGLAQILT